MRDQRQSLADVAWPSLRYAQGRFLGLPFAGVALAPGLVHNWQAWVAALMFASVATFMVYLPLTALALNGGRPLSEEAPVPALSGTAYSMLLLLWTATVWLTASAASWG